MYAVRRWSVRRARLFEVVYQSIEFILVRLHPLFNRVGYERLDKPVAVVEKAVKGFLFDCQMCGQCVLSSTGMACPMNCPKQLRNGPCGGVRANGYCEVKPEMRCVWVEAFDGSQRRRSGMSIQLVQFPVDRRLQGRSSWLRAARLKAEQLSAEKVNSNLEKTL
jgi:hypothetical protein